MQRKETGEKGYLKYRKRINLIKMIAAFAVVLLTLVTGFIIFKSKNNICTVMAVVMVLPAAKMAVGYFVLLPHKSADNELISDIEKSVQKLSVSYDCVFSNSKSPIGTLAAVATENTICAYTQEEKADTRLFETSVHDFLEQDKLKVTVTLYKDKKAFLNRIRNLDINFDSENNDNLDKMKWVTNSMKNMCL